MKITVKEVENRCRTVSSMLRRSATQLERIASAVETVKNVAYWPNGHKRCCSPRMVVPTISNSQSTLAKSSLIDGKGKKLKTAKKNLKKEKRDAGKIIKGKKMVETFGEKQCQCVCHKQ